MSRPASEAYPAASEDDRRDIFSSVRVLMQHAPEAERIPAMQRYWRDGISGVLMPLFIRERLPATSFLNAFGVHIMWRTAQDEMTPDEEPAPVMRLRLTRTEVQPNFRDATKWAVYYLIKDAEAGYETERIVNGHDFVLPEHTPEDSGDPVGDRAAQGRYQRQIKASAVPTTQESGPWPPGLVHPEAQQLVTLLGDLAGRAL